MVKDISMNGDMKNKKNNRQQKPNGIKIIYDIIIRFKNIETDLFTAQYYVPVREQRIQKVSHLLKSTGEHLFDVSENKILIWLVSGIQDNEK